MSTPQQWKCWTEALTTARECGDTGWAVLAVAALMDDVAACRSELGIDARRAEKAEAATHEARRMRNEAGEELAALRAELATTRARLEEARKVRDELITGVSSPPESPDNSIPDPDYFADSLRMLGANLPCGCRRCTCEDDTQCQGCGARKCAAHAIRRPPSIAATEGEPDDDPPPGEEWSALNQAWYPKAAPVATFPALPVDPAADARMEGPASEREEFAYAEGRVDGNRELLAQRDALRSDLARVNKEADAAMKQIETVAMQFILAVEKASGCAPLDRHEAVAEVARIGADLASARAELAKAKEERAQRHQDHLRAIDRAEVAYEALRRERDSARAERDEARKGRGMAMDLLAKEKSSLSAALAQGARMRKALERGSVLGVLDFFTRNARRPEGGEQFPNLECVEMARDAVRAALSEPSPGWVVLGPAEAEDVANELRKREGSCCGGNGGPGFPAHSEECELARVLSLLSPAVPGVKP